MRRMLILELGFCALNIWKSVKSDSFPKEKSQSRAIIALRNTPLVFAHSKNFHIKIYLCINIILTFFKKKNNMLITVAKNFSKL